jgi:hypothetical protein
LSGGQSDREFLQSIVLGSACELLHHFPKVASINMDECSGGRRYYTLLLLLLLLLLVSFSLLLLLLLMLQRQATQT